MKLENSRQLQKRARELIPGGCHTYAKGDDQYPLNAPGFLARGQGCHVWDADGNEFIEYGMGLRAVTLGHAYPPVIEAAYRQMLLGSNFTRPSPIEVEVAEELVDLIDAAEMVKFCKNGSDATTAAVKLARAFTGRDKVAICKSHPFFSTDDWFIGSTPLSAGIPQAISSLTLEYPFNDLAALDTLFESHPDQIACVILEPATAEEPRDGFLERVQALCRKRGAILIFDEMITGFRWHLRGAQAEYGVTPDLATFGKALGNGFAVSALVGRRELMRLGGLDHDRERVFLLSTTHGAETHALAAGRATLETYVGQDVVGRLYQQGERLRAGVQRAIAEAGVEGYFELLGRPCNLIYATRDPDGERSQSFRALFLQEIIRGGVIAPSFVVSYAHEDADIDRSVEVVAAALRVYRKALEEGVEKFLVGPPVKPVWRRFA